MRTRKQLEKFANVFNIKPQNEEQWSILGKYLQKCDESGQKLAAYYPSFNIKGKIMDNYLKAVKKVIG